MGSGYHSNGEGDIPMSTRGLPAHQNTLGAILFLVVWGFAVCFAVGLFIPLCGGLQYGVPDIVAVGIAMWGSFSTAKHTRHIPLFLMFGGVIGFLLVYQHSDGCRWLGSQTPPRKVALLALWSAIIVGSALLCRFAALVGRRRAEELDAMRLPRCAKCEYLLVGLTDPRCPECGETFDSALLNWEQLDKILRGADGRN